MKEKEYKSQYDDIHTTEIFDETEKEKNVDYRTGGQKFLTVLCCIFATITIVILYSLFITLCAGAGISLGGLPTAFFAGITFVIIGFVNKSIVRKFKENAYYKVEINKNKQVKTLTNNSDIHTSIEHEIVDESPTTQASTINIGDCAIQYSLKKDKNYKHYFDILILLLLVANGLVNLFATIVSIGINVYLYYFIVSCIVSLAIAVLYLILIFKHKKIPVWLEIIVIIFILLPFALFAEEILPTWVL